MSSRHSINWSQRPFVKAAQYWAHCLTLSHDEWLNPRDLGSVHQEHQSLEERAFYRYQSYQQSLEKKISELLDQDHQSRCV